MSHLHANLQLQGRFFFFFPLFERLCFLATFRHTAMVPFSFFSWSLLFFFGEFIPSSPLTSAFQRFQQVL